MFRTKKRIKALENYLGIRYTESRYRGEDGEYLTEGEWGKMFDINKMLEEKRKQEEKQKKLIK